MILVIMTQSWGHLYTWWHSVDVMISNCQYAIKLNILKVNFFDALVRVGVCLTRTPDSIALHWTVQFAQQQRISWLGILQRWQDFIGLIFGESRGCAAIIFRGSLYCSCCCCLTLYNILNFKTEHGQMRWGYGESQYEIKLKIWELDWLKVLYHVYWIRFLIYTL